MASFLQRTIETYQKGKAIMFEKAKARALGSERKTDAQPWSPQSFPCCFLCSKGSSSHATHNSQGWPPLFLQLKSGMTTQGYCTSTGEKQVLKVPRSISGQAGKAYSNIVIDCQISFLIILLNPFSKHCMWSLSILFRVTWEPNHREGACC